MLHILKPLYCQICHHLELPIIQTIPIILPAQFRVETIFLVKYRKQDLSRKCSAWKVFRLSFCPPPPLRHRVKYGWWDLLGEGVEVWWWWGGGVCSLALE